MAVAGKHRLEDLMVKDMMGALVDDTRKGTGGDNVFRRAKVSKCGETSRR